MKISKEQILALKISIFLLIFGFAVLYFMPIIHTYIPGISLNQGKSKYVIYISLTVLSYIISYFLAKITIQPIEQHNQKLREYNHNLAHEIKTPLSVIKMNLELLQYGYDEKLVNSSQEEVVQMQEIIDGLLFLSENNTLGETQSVSIQYLVEAYIGDDIDLQIQEDFIVQGNLSLLERAIKNIIENARKYKSSGKITIMLDKNSFSVVNQTHQKLEKEDILKLFDTFYQGDNSHSDTGYGLGLSIVRKIADIHNLKVKITFQAGIFSMTLFRY